MFQSVKWFMAYRNNFIVVSALLNINQGKYYTEEAYFLLHVQHLTDEPRSMAQNHC